MKQALLAATGALLAGALLASPRPSAASGSGSAARPIANPTAPPGASPIASPPRPTEVCATGCSAAGNAPVGVTDRELRELLSKAQAGPWSADNLALETLLFHGARTREFLEAEQGPDPSAPRAAAAPAAAWREHLEHELERARALLSVRVTSEDGAVLLARSRVPLGHKQHLGFDRAVGGAWPEVSGTVRRVGLRHLWVRL